MVITGGRQDACLPVWTGPRTSAAAQPVNPSSPVVRRPEISTTLRLLQPTNANPARSESARSREATSNDNVLVAYVCDVHLTNYLLAYLLSYNQHITHSQLWRVYTVRSLRRSHRVNIHAIVAAIASCKHRVKRPGLSAEFLADRGNGSAYHRGL